MIMFMQVPIGWKKAQCEACIQWRGWEINFTHDAIKLAQAKIDKLLQQIEPYSKTPKHVGSHPMRLLAPRGAEENFVRVGNILDWEVFVFFFSAGWVEAGQAKLQDASALIVRQFLAMRTHSSNVLNVTDFGGVQPARTI